MADELLDTADIFEINKLTAEELLSEEKIKYIFAIDNPVQKQKVLNQFEERAKTVKNKKKFFKFIKSISKQKW